MNETKQHNQRKDERSPIELAASYGITDEDVSKDATITNMSLGGFAFTSKDNIKTGEKIMLNVEIEDGRYVQLNVRVAWSKQNFEHSQYIVGVEMVNKTGKNYEKFLDFYTRETQE